MKSTIIDSSTFSGVPPIAFFCAEYAVSFDKSLYAGGLGVLADDFLFEAADQKMPFVAIGIKYSKTKTAEDGFELLVGMDDAPIVVDVPIGEKVGAEKTIFLQAWVKRFGETSFLLLLDTDFARNAPEDRVMGDLYDHDFSTRLKQEVYTGIGGFRLLKALGLEPKKYHLNEGSVAFAALAVLAESFPELRQNPGELLKAVQAKIVASKHTILSVGMKVSVDELWKMIGVYCEMFGVSREFLMSFGAYKTDKNLFSTTRFLLGLSGQSNGVSEIHIVFEKQKYPESRLIAITNGVYVPRWQSALWRESGDVADLSAQKVWEIKKELRRELVEEVRKLSGVQLSPDVCTLVWARRFVAYKRPLALFTDMLRLKNVILNSAMPLQIIISGEVSKTDVESMSIMEKVRAAAQDPMFEGKIAFVPDYCMAMADKFVTGGDIWLNTPERGIEACGTSGMKAGLNGALMVSVSDGWVDEVNWQGIGWVLPDNIKDLALFLYETLEQQILPEFYLRDAEGVPQSWVNRMRATMNLVATDFSAKKMLQAYDKKMYN